MKETTFNRIFNIFILVGMFTAVAYINAVRLSEPGARLLWQGIATAGALAGVINVVLSAKGSIWNYLFGLIDVLAMTAVTLEASLGNPNPTWGLFAIHAFFLLPMQFIGFFQWRKRGATREKQVQARRLSLKQWGLVILGFALALPLLYWLLNFVGTENSPEFNTVIFFDTVVVALSVVAQVLMALAFSDQWILWICINIASVALFWFKSTSSTPDSYTVVYMIKYIFYFINSLNGLRIWMGLSRHRGGDSCTTE